MTRLNRSILLLALGLAACRDESTAPITEANPADDAAASRLLEGRLHIVWRDPPPTGGPTAVHYYLVDDRGRATLLDLDDRLAARLGGPTGLSRRKARVEIDGTGLRVRVRSIDLDPAPAAATLPPQLGSVPYVTIACKFADFPDETRPIEEYRQWTAGTTYPGLDHYWREQSYNRMDVSGSSAVGWYTLPRSLESYRTSWGVDLNAMAEDCTGAADADVDFRQYYGVNLQFNADMGGSWGGHFPLTRDGETRIVGMTWLASWANLCVYAHEEGHTLGLMHSSGPYEATYDSNWDVMSNPWTPDGIPQHTIAWHKALLGWMPAARTLTVHPNTRHSVTLERVARPGAGNYRLVRIPLTDVPDGPEYTVEAKRIAGYDVHLPGEAVVIHQADMMARSDRWAQVVDPDHNGDPNDAAAQWTVGETFTDAAWGISVTVEAATATGFRVTIVRRTSGLWMGLSQLLTPRKTFALAASGGLLYVMGGLGDGTLNSVEAYDPAADTWETRAPMPAGRYDGTGAASINGLVYVPGGRNPSRILTKTLHVYNTVANTWSTKAPMPIASGCGGTVAIDGRLYVLTGCTAAGSATGRLHRYTPSTDTWTARASAPAAHSFPAVGALDGRLYVAGGRDAAGAPTATLHVYDPAANAWSTRAPMPAARFGAAGRAVNGKFYVVGGSSGQGEVATVFVYDAVTNRWSSTTPMPTARAKLGVGAVGGRLYAVGGQSGSAALGQLERYTP